MKRNPPFSWWWLAAAAGALLVIPQTRLGVLYMLSNAGLLPRTTAPAASALRVVAN